MAAEAHLGHHGDPEPNGIGGHHGAVNIMVRLDTAPIFLIIFERGPQVHTLILTEF